MAKNAKTAADKELDDLKSTLGKKELDDLVNALGENRLSLCKPCMQGTRATILQKIENDIKNVDGHSVIWIRGSPVLEGWKAAITVETNDGPLTGLSNR